MSDSPILIERFVSPLFDENTYLLHLDGETECVVIDPGLDCRKLLKKVERSGWELTSILFTHGHGDHIAGAAELLTVFPKCKLLIGRGDAAMLTSATKNLSASFDMPMTLPKANTLLDGGETLKLAGLELVVHHIPGHTTGHVVYRLTQTEPEQVFVGDTVFRGSIGRSDFPGGDHDQLVAAIRREILSLDDDTILLCGHGDATTVGRERNRNPYL
ncbi:MAG: MBL fold metallo-hydrolase [Thermoguttaceae bacterium]